MLEFRLFEIKLVILHYLITAESPKGTKWEKIHILRKAYLCALISTLLELRNFKKRKAFFLSKTKQRERSKEVYCIPALAMGIFMSHTNVVFIHGVGLSALLVSIGRAMRRPK